MMEIITPINAIMSWEGYEIQGHIALYVALGKIKENIISGNANDLWDLEIEGKEDFSILYDGKYISLHQVKSGKVNLKKNDKFAFIVELLQNEAQYGYFHINSTQQIPVDFIDIALEYINDLKVKLENPVCNKCDVSKENEEDYIIIENIKPQTEKASLYQILNHTCQNNKSKSNVQRVIDELKVELEKYESLIKEKRDEFILENTYKNEDEVFLKEWQEKFDDSKQVYSKSAQLIGDILITLHPNWTFVNNDYCEFVYVQLFAMLKEHISDFFIKKNKNGKCLISFEKIRNTLECNYTDKMETLAYKYFIILSSINSVYLEYLENDCKMENCSLCEKNDECNLFSLMQELLAKNKGEKENLLFNLLLEKPEKINNLPSDELIRVQLIEMFKEISSLSIGKKEIVQTMSPDGVTYRLSLDESRDIKRLQKKLQKGIEQSEDKALLYECNVLITDQLNEKYFKIDGSSVCVLEQQQLDEIRAITGNEVMENEKYNCYKPNVIRLINAVQAKGELNK